jgi:hypothetical protein
VKKFGGRNEIWQDRQLLHFFSGLYGISTKVKNFGTKKNWKILIHDKEREKKMGDINRNGRKQKTNSFLYLSNRVHFLSS